MNEEITNYLHNEVLPSLKGLARQKILAFLPDWKQSNLNARFNELNEVRFSRALTQDEAIEVEMMRALWDRAKDIRAASDLHEAAILALDSIEQVRSYNYRAGWPEE